MIHIILQISCIILVALFYLFAKLKNKIKGFRIYELNYILLITSLVIDGVISYLINTTDVSNLVLYKVLYSTLFLAFISVILLMVYYVSASLNFKPKKAIVKYIVYLPAIIGITLILGFIYQARIDNMILYYINGISAYSFYSVLMFYVFVLFLFSFKSWGKILTKYRVLNIIYLIILFALSVTQLVLLNLPFYIIIIVLLFIGITISFEIISLKNIVDYKSDIIPAFSNSSAAENKKAHVNRSCKYVEILACELKSKGLYKNILTNEYLENLIKAAPMHDIGKISIPDDILQKPGRLTTIEYDVMKQHAIKGGEIIKRTFNQLDDKNYLDVAYNITMYHHEKWNGTGYPSGLKGNDIPLCARIMAIADVFDAVSEKRCYRDAMPIDECFNVIENGRGTDFEPLLVDVFLSLRNELEEVYNSK